MCKDDIVYAIHPNDYVTFRDSRFVVYSCGFALIDFTHLYQDYFIVTDAMLRLPKASETTLNNIDKLITWLHQERAI